MNRRVVVTMTCLGLFADFAYLLTDVASRFILIGEWGFGAAYMAMSYCCVLSLLTGGWGRAKAALAQARKDDL